MQKKTLSMLNFEEIYAEYFPKIYNFIFYRLLSREDTEDLVSEVFFKVAKNLGRFDEGKAKLKTWIYRIAQNTLIDFYRSRKTEASLDAEETGYEPSVDFEEQLERIASPKRQALYRELQKLKERERLIVYYRFFEGLDYSAICELMGLNYQSAYNLLQRSLSRLREMYGILPFFFLF